MDIFRAIRSVNISAIPPYALNTAQQGINGIRRDVQSWMSFVDFLIRPVDVNLALENGDVDLSRSRRAF